MRHNWVLNFTYALPGRNLTGLTGAVFSNWNLSGIWTMRSGNPLTAFVTTNRSRSQWNPSRGPGIGQDPSGLRPRLRPRQRGARASRTSGSTRRRSCCSRPARSATPAAATSSGPTCARSTLRSPRRPPGRGSAAGLEFRVEAFNVLNRANFGIPELRAFAGARDGEPVLATFGRNHEHGDLGAADSAGGSGHFLVRGLAGRGLDELAAR